MNDDRDPGPAPSPKVAEPAYGVDRGDRPHEFHGPGVSVTWSRRRCIHVAECVFGLPTVFEPGRRPWVDATQAAVDAIARVVARCPTGALHCTRTDGAVEAPPAVNMVRPAPDGPLYLHGDIEVLDESGALRLADTRVALCRCGRSANKPLCNGAHLVTGFHDAGAVRDASALTDPGAADGKLRVRPEPNGPLRLEGRITLVSADRGTVLGGSRARLCRCGRSQNKPFCDGSHERTEFRSG
jgi:CDGSH-type Zn-finger protein/uncharacterized Fe-S cluster protein YjdI